MANPLQTLLDERMVEGEIRGKREALRTFLHIRFGVLPETLERRISLADAEQLDTLVERAAIVTNLDDL